MLTAGGATYDRVRIEAIGEGAFGNDGTANSFTALSTDLFLG